MGPHKLFQRDGNVWRCSMCAVEWPSLTQKDRQYLTSRGQCHGTDERWRRCRFTGNHCLGQHGHERCAPLVDTLDWGPEDLGAYVELPDPEG